MSGSAKLSAEGELGTVGTAGESLDAADRIAVVHLIALAVIALLLAIAVRLPHLSESFWVDELHSAWTVWSELGDVTGRAALGNQTPVYYWGLWFWRRAVGDGEVALRMSSVILSSLACALVAAGVARYSRSLTGGALAGAALALEPSAIFFGTELRVFAAVMLLAAIACWAWCQQRQSEVGRSTAVLFAAVMLAAIIQPMSLGVLGWLCLSSASAAPLDAWLRRQPAGHRAGLIVLAVLVAAVCGSLLWWLAGRVLLSAWQHRDQWAAFAAAHSPLQIWNLWRWDLLLLIPLVLAAIAAVADRCGTQASTRCPSGRSCARFGGRWLPLATVAVGATALFWLLSAAEIAAIFHRRFLIAALPVAIWAGGMAIGEFCRRIRHRFLNPVYAAPVSGAALAAGVIGAALAAGVAREDRQPPLRCLQTWCFPANARAGAVLLAGFALAAILFLQFGAPTVATRLRGENWRAAAAYISAQPAATGPVLLSPGLIETQRMLSSGDPVHMDYLAYPLSGPYALPRVEVIHLGKDPRTLHDSILANRSRFALLRLRHSAAQRWAERVALAGGPSAPLSFSVQNFGGVQVIEFFVAEATDAAGAEGLAPRSQ